MSLSLRHGLKDFLTDVENLFFETPITLDLRDLKPARTDEARLSISLSVHGKTASEQNAALAAQLRKVADEVEAQVPEEGLKQEAPPAPKVSWNIKRS